ncbi:glutamate-5-semialdehyde dehydrogenase [Glycocaulis profundi]|nr:glutamate-5-semialdehyde dehydrogenase [Glycocaulis profundi]
MPDYVTPVAEKARAAARVLARATTANKNAAIKGAAEAIRARSGEILSANAKDVAAAKDDGKPAAFIDRLALDEGRVEGIAAALDALIALPDPVGRVLNTEKRPNGLEIRRVATPLGVIGIIYESRPNVAADAGALCLKSGNAVILRGGSDSVHSTGVIVECLQDGLKSAGLPAEAVQTLGTTDRAAVAQMLRANGLIDLIIPRGGKGLTSLVMEESRVPTLLHLDGNNHVYVHESADLAKAVEVVKNAKLRRTGVCGAAETVVVDRKVAKDLLPKLADALEGCELRGEDEARGIEARIKPATEQDWDTEYLDAILAVKIVEGIDEALAFVSKHSSAHTESIIAEDADAATRFLEEIDSAIVMHNASTQFADGGEFGMGAEIGIATGRLHARGPVGLEQLNTFKYQVLGSGQTRP